MMMLMLMLMMMTMKVHVKYKAHNQECPTSFYKPSSSLLFDTRTLQNILLAFAHRVCNVLSFVWAHSLCLFEPHRCAQAKAAAAIPTAIVARCPLRIKHCIVPIAQCLLPTTLCPSLTAHYPLPFAWPGGMRGAIESAALAVWQELACQTQSTSP